MNRLRARGEARIPFFSFQDIITAVTGILILITLILTFSLKLGDADTEDERLQAQLRRDRERLVQIENENERIQQRRLDAANLSNPTQLQSQIDALRRERERLDEQRRQSAAALAALRQKSQSHPQSAAELRADAAASAQQIEELREKLGQAKTNVNVVFVIPDEDLLQAQKTPLALIVNGNSIRAQRLDGAAARHVAIENEASLNPLLDQYDMRRDLLVFYFRPSGAKWFEPFRARARAAGFEIGYDAIEEHKEIVFAAP